MNTTRLIVSCTASLLLFSCTPLQSVIPASEPTPPTEQVNIQSENKWWNSFNDTLMDELVSDLLKQNLDIQIAQARIMEARGLERISASGFFPDISLAGNSSRSSKNVGLTKPVSISQGGFDAKWELDIFGQTSAAVDAATQRVQSKVASADDVKNSVVAELMKSIIEWRAAAQTVKETSELLKTQDEQVSLISARAKAGLIDATFVARAQAERSQTATKLPLAQASLDASEYKIERLLGKHSGELKETLDTSEGELVVPHVETVLDISIDTLKNRPDIRASAFDLLATKADLARAEAELWPRISISSFFGVQDGSNNVRLAENPIWSVASGLTMPLLNFGKLQGAIDAADGVSQAAQLSYENASLTALAETKTALSDYLNGINAANEQEKALNFRKEAVSLASDRFKQGLTDMTDLTTAQSELNQATLLYIERKQAAAIAYVRLHKALGTSVVKK